MQDQGKRLMLAVGLALIVMLTWQMIFKPKDADQPDQKGSGSAVVTQQGQAHSQVGVATGEQPAQPAQSSGPSAPAAPSAPTATAPVVAPEPVRGPEQKITLDYPAFHATFSSYGGVLQGWKLTDPRYERDATKGELLPEYGAFSVNFAASTYVLPEKTEWTGEKVSPNEVRYTYHSDTFDLVKDFTIVPDAFLVKMNISVVMHVPAGKEAHQTLAVTSWQRQDPAVAASGSSRIAARAWSSSVLRDGEIYSTDVPGVIESARKESGITWAGYEHPYLLIAFAPKPATGSSAEMHVYATKGGLMETDLLFEPASTFKADDHTPLSRELVAYLGPKNYNQLEHADEAAGFSTGIKKTVDLGWFDFIAKPLLWLLLKFQSVIGNWGLSIMLLTLLVKGATLFWTTKSMRSMKAMAVLGPQMKALQEKFKDDKQRLQIETMALYKQHGVNPLAGCLPILLQMPIWLALYRMLSNAGELYLQPFIPGWINDLTGTDPYYVLPVILVVTMFVQARLTPTNPDPSQKMQQNIMKWGMPIMFGAMSFVFPAGLTLYIFTNTILSAVHSIWMNKFDKKSLELAAKLKKQTTTVTDKAAVASAKDANPKDAGKGASKPEPPRAITSGDDEDDADEADEAEQKPRVRASQRRKKGGRRR